MSLVGTYYNDNTGETLYIDTADDSSGTLTGRLDWPLSQGAIPVQGLYGFQSEETTFLLFWAKKDLPPDGYYEVWSGTGSRSSDYPELIMLGARTHFDNGDTPLVSGLLGDWERQNPAA